MCGYRFVCVCDVVYCCVRVSVFCLNVSLHVRISMVMYVNMPTCQKLRDTTYTCPKCPFYLNMQMCQKMEFEDLKNPMSKKRTLGTSGFWEVENTQPSQCLAALVRHVEWEREPPLTTEGGLGTSATALCRLLSADLEAAGFRSFLPGWHRRVMEPSRADFEFAARSASLLPDPSPESIVSTALPPENQDSRDARYRFSCPDCGWGG